MLHEIEEDALMEFAGLVGHLLKNSINSLKLVRTSELVKYGRKSGIVVVETLLVCYHVEYVQCPLWISLMVDQVYGILVRY